jgi:hypothetical protein
MVCVWVDRVSCDGGTYKGVRKREWENGSSSHEMGTPLRCGLDAEVVLEVLGTKVEGTKVGSITLSKWLAVIF